MLKIVVAIETIIKYGERMSRGLNKYAILKAIGI
jgi:hypothetical protein